MAIDLLSDMPDVEINDGTDLLPDSPDMQGASNSKSWHEYEKERNERGEKTESGKRKATWDEFTKAFHSFGPVEKLPDDAEFSPLQSAAVGFQGAVGDVGHGLQQGAANLLGMTKWQQKNKLAAEAKRAVTQQSSAQNPASTMGGQIAGSVAASLPFAGVGGAAGSKVAPWAIRGIEGGLFGKSQYTTDKESDLLNTALGATSAIAIPEILGAGYNLIKGGAKRFLGMPGSSIASDIIKPEGASQSYKNQILKEAKKRVEAGEKTGVNLTPAEATGSPNIAQKQATIGRTPEGATKLEEHYRGKGGRYEQENKAVDNFYKKLGVTEKDVSAETARKVREASQDIIKEQVQDRKSLSKPIYKRAKSTEIPEAMRKNLLTDENIITSKMQVDKNPTYKEAAKKMNEDSIEYWDLIKRNLDDKIESAFKSGDSNKGRLLLQSKTKLINKMDQVSPMYKAARKVFSNESEVLGELYGSNLGKIAKLDDKQLKNVSKILFDPAEIDPKTLNTVRDKLFKENKQVYYDALAQNMKNKTDTLAKTATKREAPAFYKAILSNDKTYNMYKDALKQNPAALRRLEWMKTAFQDLGGDYTPKSITALQKTGMTNQRDVMATLGHYLSEAGKYDEVAIDFITNPKWIDQADKILSQKDSALKTQALKNLIVKITQSHGFDLLKDTNEKEAAGRKK